MTTTVFIDGDQGTTGLRIVQRLADRPGLFVKTLPAAQRKDPRHRAEALNNCDIAILCLPDEAAREAVAWINNPAVRVIDASSAHRVDGQWTYGLPELSAGQSERIATSKRVSNPGCYPTAALALLRPLREAGLLPADYPLAIHATSGYSGRGRAGMQAHEDPQSAAQPPWQIYGLGLNHKHLPEIQQHGLLARPPIFVPAYGNYAQGIALTIPLHRHLLPSTATPRRLHEALTAHHVDSDQVRVLPFAPDRTPDHLDPTALNQTDDMELHLFASPSEDHVLLAAVLDNLGKGAAGAAVRNLELMRS